MNPFRYDTTENKISGTLLLLFGVSLPFDRFYSELLLIVLGAHTLIHLRASRWRQVRWMHIAQHAALLLLSLAALAWSHWKAEGVSYAGHIAALLLLPLCLSLLAIDLKRYQTLILLAFALTNVLVGCWLFIDAFRTIAFYGKPLSELWQPAFFGHNFSEPVAMHATYLSLYFAFSVFILLQQMLRDNTKGWLKLLLSAGILVMAAGMFQLGSRAVLAGSVVAALLVVPWMLRSRKAKLTWTLAFIASLAAGGWLVNHHPQMHDRIVSGFVRDLAHNRGSGDVADPRGSRWKLAGDLILEKPFFGHGTGAEVPLLRDAYFRNRMYDSYLNALNAHNQYFSVAIGCGLAGLCIWLWALGAWGVRALRQKNVFLMAFLVLFCCTAVSENVLHLNKGIFFFAFFGAILALEKRRIPDTAGNHRSPVRVFTYKHRQQPVL